MWGRSAKTTRSLAGIALLTFASAAPLAADGTPAPPKAPARLSADEARSLLTDLRVGLALQDRLAGSLAPEGVERVFAQMLQANPDHKILRFLRARAQRGAAPAAEMRALAKERLGLAPTERYQVGAAWFAVARREAELGQLDPALEAAGYALRLDPNAPSYALVGWIYQKKGDAARAITAYAGALKLDPRQISTRIAVTDLLLRAGRVEEALKVGRGTLLLAPRSALGQLYWGTALALSGDADGRTARLPACATAVGQRPGRRGGDQRRLEAHRRTAPRARLVAQGARPPSHAP